MSIAFPTLSKKPNAEEIQSFLDAVAVYLQQKSQEDFMQLDKKESPLDGTADVTNNLINSLFEKISTESLQDIGLYLLNHPDAIARATTAAIGAAPNPMTVAVLGLMMLVTSSTTSSAMATTASKNLEAFMKTYSKDK